MSLTMDDLCASLSSNHIGQEAIDLAALQLQLAQTLFRQPIPCTPSRQHNPDNMAQPCNTPTGRTPSASFSWSPMVDMTREPVTPARRITEDEMDEDERMVEDLLMPSSPVPATPQTPSNKSPSYGAADASPSLFAATDPFYLAQVQASQNYNTSVFAQAAFPSAQSPFFLQRPNHAQPTLSMDHLMPLVATASYSTDR